MTRHFCEHQALVYTPPSSFAYYTYRASHSEKSGKTLERVAIKDSDGVIRKLELRSEQSSEPSFGYTALNGLIWLGGVSRYKIELLDVYGNIFPIVEGKQIDLTLKRYATPRKYSDTNTEKEKYYINRNIFVVGRSTHHPICKNRAFIIRHANHAQLYEGNRKLGKPELHRLELIYCANVGIVVEETLNDKPLLRVGYVARN